MYIVVRARVLQLGAELQLVNHFMLEHLRQVFKYFRLFINVCFNNVLITPTQHEFETFNKFLFIEFLKQEIIISKVFHMSFYDFIL
jgi:hypothetical protein